MAGHSVQQFENSLRRGRHFTGSCQQVAIGRNGVGVWVAKPWYATSVWACRRDICCDLVGVKKQNRRVSSGRTSPPISFWLRDGTDGSNPSPSGATMERPSLYQLLAEIQAGRVDIVVAYKVEGAVGVVAPPPTRSLKPSCGWSRRKCRAHTRRGDAPRLDS